MGTNVSKQESDVFRKTVTDMSLDALKENIVSDTKTTVINQLLKNANFKGATINCDMNFSQDAVLKQTKYSKITDDQEQSFKQDLENRMNDTFNNITEQTLKDLNLFQTNVSDVKQKLSTVNVSDLSTKIVNKTTADINESIEVNQTFDTLNYEGAIINPAPGSTQCNLNISQNADVTSITDNVVNNVLKTDNIAQVSNDLVGSMLAGTGQIGEGTDIAEVISSIGGAVAMAVLIPVLVIAVGVFIFFMVARYSPTSWLGKKIYKWFPKFANKSKNAGKKIPVAEPVSEFGLFFGFGKKKKRGRKRRR